MRPHRHPPALWALLLCAATACDRADRAGSGPTPPGSSATGDNAEADQALRAGLSQVINDATNRYKPLNYRYDEDLLAAIDQIEAHLSGGAPGPAPRFLPDLTEEEERDHFRETIRLWEAQTGRSPREAIDPLKAEVAARPPGDPPFHPAFHVRCRAVFDDLIKFEVLEMRQRRNRAIHEQAAPLLDRYRATHPELTRDYQESLDKGEYRVTDSAPPLEAPAPPPKPRSS